MMTRRLVPHTPTEELDQPLRELLNLVNLGHLWDDSGPTPELTRYTTRDPDAAAVLAVVLHLADCRRHPLVHRLVGMRPDRLRAVLDALLLVNGHEGPQYEPEECAHCRE